jgi:hypothetical protein
MFEMSSKRFRKVWTGFKKVVKQFEKGAKGCKMFEM